MPHIRDRVYVRTTAHNCLKLLVCFGQSWAVFVQLHATRMRVLGSGGDISAFSVSQSVAAVLVLYAYHRSPVACKPGHVVGHGTEERKLSANLWHNTCSI